MVSALSPPEILGGVTPEWSRYLPTTIGGISRKDGLGKSFRPWLENSTPGTTFGSMQWSAPQWSWFSSMEDRSPFAQPGLGRGAVPGGTAQVQVRTEAQQRTAENFVSQGDVAVNRLPVRPLPLGQFELELGRELLHLLDGHNALSFTALQVNVQAVQSDGIGFGVRPIYGGQVGFRFSVLQSESTRFPAASG